MSDLVSSLVGVLRPWVVARLGELGVEASEELAASLDEAERWLRAELDALLELPFEQQRRGPLELFQEAMRFPTAVLEAAGVAQPKRDEVTRTALPGDVYGLAPASSRQLGDDAWEAHLAWGAAKATALRGPVPSAFGVYTANLMDGSRFDGVPGWRAVTWRSADAIPEEPPLTCFVDLAAPGADDAIQRLAAGGATVYAFGPHVDDVAMVRARSLGAADALARSRFFRIFPDLLPPVV